MNPGINCKNKQTHKLQKYTNTIKDGSVVVLLFVSDDVDSNHDDCADDDNSVGDGDHGVNDNGDGDGDDGDNGNGDGCGLSVVLLETESIKLAFSRSLRSTTRTQNTTSEL